MITSLEQEILDTLTELNHQIDNVRDVATSMNITAHQLRNTDGSFVFGPLLVAKANLLFALASMTEKDR